MFLLVMKNGGKTNMQKHTHIELRYNNFSRSFIKLSTTNFNDKHHHGRCFGKKMLVFFIQERATLYKLILYLSSKSFKSLNRFDQFWQFIEKITTNRIWCMRNDSLSCYFIQRWYILTLSSRHLCYFSRSCTACNYFE